MQQILDLHIHSKYSRSCSTLLTLENIDRVCRLKGVDIIATGDFTFPQWFSAIKDELEEITSCLPAQAGLVRGRNNRGGEGAAGLYKLKTAKDDKIKFILSTEVALIYKAGDKVRRIHLMIHAPNIKAVEELNNFLDKKYNIRSDGRPIFGMSAPDLMKLCLSIHPKFLIYPAHIWTPWFAVFGSKSGFDSMEECFKGYTRDIYAIETGLSSDPAMNWRLSALGNYTILSNSDAHSLPNIGREANVFEMKEISYDEIYDIIKNKKIYFENNKNLDSRFRGNDSIGIKSTIEFYPEEGMYHYDGHRVCGIRFTPEQTRKNKDICPVCKKPLTIGVMNRVEQLADRGVGYQPESAVPFVKLVELDKIIAEALNIKSRQSTKVLKEYNNLVKPGINELKVLLQMDLAELKTITLPEIVEGISRVRQGKLIIEPGFDGQYGTIKIFSDQEKASKQTSLFK